MKQIEFKLAAKSRGFHLVTSEVNEALAPLLSGVAVGVCHLFIKHTSASLTINENADPDVRTDMEMAVNKIIAEDFPYIHTEEGPDDMPAHVKASFLGSSVNLPVSDGKLNLGTWQGIYLGEHRDRAISRSLVATILT